MLDGFVDFVELLKEPKNVLKRAEIKELSGVIVIWIFLNGCSHNMKETSNVTCHVSQRKMKRTLPMG